MSEESQEFDEQLRKEKEDFKDNINYNKNHFNYRYKYRNKAGFCCHKGMNLFNRSDKIRCCEECCYFLKDCKIKENEENE